MCDSRKNKHTFTWIFKKYCCSILMYFDSKEIRSPPFTTEHFGGATWYLSMRDASDNNEGVLLSLCRFSDDKGSDVVRIQWKCSCVSPEKDIFLSCYNKKEFSVVDGFKRGYSRTAYQLKRGDKFDFRYLTSGSFINCHMKGYSRVENPLSSKCNCQTIVELFNWSPLNVLEIKLCSGPEGLQYEVFFLVSNDDVSISIRRSDNKNFLLCYFMYRLSVTYGEVENTPNTRDKTGWSKPFQVGDTLEIPTTFSKNEYPDSKFINDVHINGVFVISVVDNKEAKIAQEKQKLVPALKLDSANILKDDLLRMYENKKHTDVKLKIDNDIFPAHKGLLSSRSPVFSAMFDETMAESLTGIVNITDMDSSTLNLLLKYMYTGVLDELYHECALKLLLVAEKYQVLSLKEKCSHYLMANLSDENVCSILVAADMISHPDLKSSAMNYVQIHAHKVLQSDSWKKLVINNVNLVSETLSIISKEFGNISNKNCGIKRKVDMFLS